MTSAYACDICRKRKVKCDRTTPCARCRRLRQPCTYTDVLRKKGPKFVHSYPTIFHSAPRNVHLPEYLHMVNLSGTDVSTYTASGCSTSLDGIGLQPAMGGTGSTSEVAPELDDLDFDLNFGETGGIERVPNLEARQGVPPDTASAMETLALYAERLYPLFPVLDLAEMQCRLLSGNWSSSPTQHALLLSLRAAVHAQSSLREEDGHLDACEGFLDEALWARSQSQYQAELYHKYDNNNRDNILSAFFLFMACWVLRREKYAWWYLRECIALVLSSRMHREDEYRRLEPREAEYRRRYFWALFVAERTFCLLHDKPITLRPWIRSPSVPNAFDEEGVTPDFVRLVTLFQDVCVDLSGCWTAAGFVVPVTLSLGTTSSGNDGISAGLPIQNFEIAVSREWLRANIWKLGIPQQRASVEFVASNDNAHWRLDEPLLIGEAILGVLQSSLDTSREIWNSILEQKLCDICECLCDILPVMQTRGYPGEANMVQVLRGLLEVLSPFQGRSTYLLSRR
ncbi:hypothetical protein BJX61DRAFT_549694 [Aspergillus egyptiacus]|nr:hypothetical protein BJX61DRAFT_549694 [Aspergillus egyptiacus]